MSKRQYIMNQEVLFFTEHFGKDYVWLRDVDKTCYMLPYRDGEIVWNP